MALPADGHGDDDWLPTRVEQFSGGRDRPGYQHPQGAHSHKGRTHQWVGIVVVFCVGRRTLRMLRTIGPHVWSLGGSVGKLGQWMQQNI